MSIRRTIVEVETAGLNVSEFCAQHGISTWFFYQLRRRYRREGEKALEPRSRAPRRVANRIGEDIRDLIVTIRKELTEEGFDHGPATIRVHLERRGVRPLPSEATIWRVLRERGFVIENPKKAPKRSHRSFAASRANECWQIDPTDWQLADGSPAEIINILDDCTRLSPKGLAVSSVNLPAAWEAFMAAGKAFGFPEWVLTDNARVFRGDPYKGGGGLEVNLAALGIRAGHSRPYHPQTCGKVERFHQTLKRRLRACPPPATIAELQAQLDHFLDYYNNRRPHRALGRRTPAEVWQATPKSGPDPTSVTTPTRVHTGKVSNGRVSAGPYLISVGAAHNGETVSTITTGLNAHLFIDGRLVRSLTLDPTKRTQPLRPTLRKTMRDVSRHQ